MNKLKEQGNYQPPSLGAVETVFDKALNSVGGRIFVDLWDLKQFASCDRCFEKRKKRLVRMNLQQKVLPPISCEQCGS